MWFGVSQGYLKEASQPLEVGAPHGRHSLHNVLCIAIKPLLDVRGREFVELVFLKICPYIRSERGKKSSSSNHLGSFKSPRNLCFSQSQALREHVSCSCVHFQYLVPSVILK